MAKATTKNETPVTTPVADTATPVKRGPKGNFEYVFVDSPEALVGVPHAEGAKRWEITDGKKVVYTWCTTPTGAREGYARKVRQIGVKCLDTTERAPSDPKARLKNAVSRIADGTISMTQEEKDALIAQILGK